nr:unnamed protein product [Callosobruchus chinensis]
MQSQLYGKVECHVKELQKHFQYLEELSRYVDNNETRKSTMGRKPVITADQERELSSRIIRLVEVGYPLKI